MNAIKRVVTLLPGLGLAIVIAALAKLLEHLLPIHLIGASVIALFIGMLINCFWRPNAMFATGLKFTSKKILSLLSSCSVQA